MSSAGTRLKRAGMHWSVDGANAILAPRCRYLGDRFANFWERRPESSWPESQEITLHPRRGCCGFIRNSLH